MWHTDNGIRGKLRDCSLFLVCAVVRSILNLFGPRCLICLYRKKNQINKNYLSF